MMMVVMMMLRRLAKVVEESPTERSFSSFSSLPKNSTRSELCIQPARPLPATKLEATAIGIIARWPLENNLNVSWAQVLYTKI